MSDTPENDEMTIGLTFHNGDTMTLQQVVHGRQPQVLIKMFLTEDDAIRIELDVTGPESTADLAEMLEFIAEGIRRGEVTSDSQDQDGEGE